MNAIRYRLMLGSLALAVLAACGTGQGPATRANVVAPAAVVAPAPAAAPQPTPAMTQAPSATQAAAAAYDWDMDVFHPVVARHGMVATEQEYASRIGLSVLKAGGNAVDAAVAIGFALAVALPNAGNLGGGGFMMVHEAKTGRDIALDFREVAPKSSTRDMYLDANGNVIDGKSLYTRYAIGVPGTVAGMDYAIRHWGTMSLAKAIAPAIRLAEQGFPVSETLAKTLAQEKKPMGQWPATRAIFWKGGAPLGAGDRLVQKDLAHSMRLIAQQGAKAFYEGEIAHRIVADMRAQGGPITADDLRSYKVVEREPVRGTYRGYSIVTMPPPSSGGVHLIEILNIMENWPIRDWGHNSAQTVHHMAEAEKLAYADRSKYLGDPDFVKVPVKGLTSKAYAASLAKGIDPNHARSAKDIAPGNPMPYESDQTTHYSVMDRDGNMVAVTYTLNTNFGSGIVAPGTGILLNNEMDDFSAKPGVPNVYGLVGGEANAVQAGKRPLSSMTPTLVFKDGKPWLVTGSPGGARIITTVLQQIVNGIDFGMNPAEAASQVRFHDQWLPDELRVEKGFPVDTIRLLREKGQNVVVQAAMGRTQTIERHGDELWGYSDPRNPDGSTLGY